MCVISLQARSTAANTDHQNPLSLVSELSRVASWQIDLQNWGDPRDDCPTLPYYFFSDTYPSECCPHTIPLYSDCTAFTLQPGIIEDTFSYVGAIAPGTVIDETNAIDIIPTLLTNEPFSFLLGIAPTGIATPNPPVIPPIADKLGIGLSSNGLRLVLILGDAAATGTYTTCLQGIVIPTTTTTTPAPGTGTTTPGSPSTTNPSTTNANTQSPTTTSDAPFTPDPCTCGYANNLVVGYVALGVACVTYFNF